MSQKFNTSCFSVTLHKILSLSWLVVEADASFFPLPPLSFPAWLLCPCQVLSNSNPQIGLDRSQVVFLLALTLKPKELWV